MVQKKCIVQEVLDGMIVHNQIAVFQLKVGGSSLKTTKDIVCHGIFFLFTEKDQLEKMEWNAQTFAQ